MTKDDVIDLIQKQIGEGSQKEFAKRIGCSDAYLSDVIRGNREPGDKILKALGLIKHVDYRKPNKPTSPLKGKTI